jgi:hypothetical protein
VSWIAPRDSQPRRVNVWPAISNERPHRDGSGIGHVACDVDVAPCSFGMLLRISPEFPISNRLCPKVAPMCPEWDSNGSPRRGQRYCRGGAYARDSVLGSLTVSDHSLLLQTIVFERCKHIPLLFDRHFPLLLPEPQGHPGTRRKQLMRPSTAAHTSPGTATAAI